MKVVMINDCAYVGDTLSKYLASYGEIAHLKRTRGLWAKTFGLTWKILRAKGDVFHAHYLLQDCYLAERLGKRPLVGHAHGSDLRDGLNHKVWRRIVRHNLKRCDRIFVSTPDLAGLAGEYRSDAEYLPNPVDTDTFFPKPREHLGDKPRVLIASGCNWRLKGTDIALKGLSEVRDRFEIALIKYGEDYGKTMDLARSLGLTLNVLPKTSHENVRRYFWDADIVIDQFTMGVLGMISLEAIACGKPVITYVSSVYGEYAGFPLKDVNTSEQMAAAAEGASQKLWESQYQYLSQNHDPEIQAKRLFAVYESLIE